MDIEIDDIVEMKKQHPCGSKNWKITRLGADLKLKCEGCSRVIMISRGEFNKAVKKKVDN